jgi:hypothetical protein
VRIARRVSLTLLVAASVGFAAEPALVDLVMPEAKIVVGANIATIAASPLGQAIAGAIQNGSPEAKKFLKEIPFDPTRDLREIVAASTGEGKDPPTVFLASGTFDTARLNAFAKEQGGREAMNYQGVSILAGPKKDESVLAFLTDSVVAAGTLEQVKQAIDRRGQANRLNPQLSAKVDQWRASYDAWIVSTAAIAPLASQVPNADAQGAMKGDLLKAIEAFSGGLKLGDPLEVSAELLTHTEKDAAALADALRFLLGMILAQQQQQKALAQNFTFDVQANTVKISMKVPLQQLMQAVKGFQATAGPPSSKPAPADGGLVIQQSPKDMGTVVVPKQ